MQVAMMRWEGGKEARSEGPRVRAALTGPASSPVRNPQSHVLNLTKFSIRSPRTRAVHVPDPRT